MLSWIPYAISAGLNVVGSLLGGSQQGEMPAIEEPDWDTMRNEYETWLKGTLKPMLNPEQIRLEAQRMGVASSGAYLQGVTQMEQKYMDVLSRELGVFELQQTEQKTKWQEQKSLLKYGWETQAQQRKAGVVENIFGAISGGVTGIYGAYKQEDYMKMLQNILGGGQFGGGDMPSSEMIDILWNREMSPAVAKIYGTYGTEYNTGVMGS